MNQLVELENIHKKYRNKIIWENLSLSIYENECIALLGGNGVGKSTLLKCITGLERVNSGRVIHHKKKLKIGYAPERHPKEIRFTPREYLTYIGKMNGMRPKTISDRVNELLKLFKLDESKSLIKDLSKGNIQKVSIMQSIIHKPDLLILDEPISGLDTPMQHELVKLLKQIKSEGIAIILTYHESNVLEDLIDKTFILENQTLQRSSENTQNIEQYKLIEVSHLDKSIMKTWEEVIRIDDKEDSFILCVPIEKSNLVISRIIKERGIIETVSNDR